MSLLHLLLDIAAPGTKVPAGATQFSIGSDGLTWGWAFFALVVLILATAWSYFSFARRVSRFARVGLIVLRSLLFALLLLLLVRPVLLVTIEEAVRRPLLVLLDATQSMELVDHRDKPDDLVRAAIAAGVAAPDGGLNQHIRSGAQVDKLKMISRQQMLKALAANSKLNLWPRLYANADLNFFSFGRRLGELGSLAPRNGAQLTTDEATTFFNQLHCDESLTALGDGLEALLDQQRGQPMAGILVITDGANNTGSSPLEAAAMAKQDGVPLFIYGIGVASPQDILVSELSGPQITSVKERVEFTAHIRAQSMVGKKATIQLKADGRIVDEEPIEFRADGEQEMTLGYTPDKLGEVQLEATVPPLPEEAVKDNNTATAKLRVVDERIRVLLVEDEPHWDFQYLVTMLARDRHVKLQVVLLKGDYDLTQEKDSVFVEKLPADKDALYLNDVVILGDVAPADLGDTRMKLLNDWVDTMGGGMIFLAGPRFDPKGYQGTPLEGLLPVEILNRTADRYDHSMPLRLTPAGEISTILQLASNAPDNAEIWNQFPGVRWTAWVGKARPGAQVLLTDPNPARATAEGAMPVIAQQNYGVGQTFYIGFDETYRWRSGKGEKYYTHIWGQILQALSQQRILGASAQTQLKTDRPRYLTGDKVRISGRLFKARFESLTDPDAPGIITMQDSTAKGSAPQSSELRLEAVPDRPGEYQGEMTATTAGSYSFSLVRDPSVVLKFDVEEPRIELSDIAMNEKLLRSMASASGGKFLREEDLDGLPALVTSASAGAVSFQRIPLIHTPYLLGLIILVACAEWLWRRKRELK